MIDSIPAEVDHELNTITFIVESFSVFTIAVPTVINVPRLSEWGRIILVILFFGAGAVAIVRKRTLAREASRAERG